MEGWERALKGRGRCSCSHSEEREYLEQQLLFPALVISSWPKSVRSPSQLQQPWQRRGELQKKGCAMPAQQTAAQGSLSCLHPDPPPLASLIKAADPGLTWHMDFQPLLGALTTTQKATSTIKRPLCEYIRLGITAQLDSAPSDTANKALLGQESFSRHGWGSPHDIHTFRN